MILETDIRKIRKAAGKTQQDIADHSGLTIASVSRLENGHTKPTLETYISIIEALGYELKLNKKKK